MITEIAKLTVDPASADAFEAAIAEYAAKFSTAPGASTMTLERVIEEKGCYFMRMQWESIEAHKAVGDTDSARYWAENIRRFYTGPSRVVHASPVDLRGAWCPQKSDTGRA